MMRDLNFFSKYQVAPAKTSPTKLLMIVGGILATAAVLFWAAFLFMDNLNYKNNIESLELQLKAPEKVEELKKVDELEKNIATVKNDQIIFTNLEGDFTRIHRVNKAFMQFVQQRITQDLVFDTINIQNDSVVIEGTSTNRLSIAKFEEELRKTDKFNKILVSEISKRDPDEDRGSEDVYNFNMEIETKDVKFDEE